VVSVADKHAHKQFMVLQRSAMDELSQPLLPCCFALSEELSRIINEVKSVNRCVFDITSKPPGTMEWNNSVNLRFTR